MTKKKLAFSFIELAVVVLIIGLLTAGIMKGTSIIRSSRITAARSLTAKSRINEIPGMVAWYETSTSDSFLASQTSDTSQITEWRDISPNSIATQKNKLSRIASSAVTYKAEGINNIPSVQFLLSGNLTASSLYQGAIAQSTIFAVMRPTVAPSGTLMTLIDSNPASSTSSSVSISSTHLYIDAGNQLGVPVVLQPFAINSDYIIAAYLDNTSSKAFVNDAVISAGGITISPGSNPINGLTIGTKKASNYAFTGLISEIIIFDRPLQIEERKSIMSYLSKKYKIRVAGL